MSPRKDSEKIPLQFVPDSPESAAGEALSPVEKALEEQAAKLQAEKQELSGTLVRLQADFENYRKRIERERHTESRRAVSALIERLLPVLDDFDRALATYKPADEEYRKGFELIRRRLWETLEKEGVERIDAVGKPFNPHEHHAIERTESKEHEDGIVTAEFQAGYRLRDKVLRPAMVRVAVHPQEKSSAN